MSDFEIKVSSDQILNSNFYNVSDSESSFSQRVRFSGKKCFSNKKTCRNPSDKLFATFSPILSRAATAYNIIIQDIIAIAVQLLTFVLISTRDFFLFCLLSHFFSVWTLYIQKLAATKSATKTRTVFMSHMCD